MGAVARRSYHHKDLVNALLDAAESLARERGARGWSLREVAAQVGVSPSAAYHHFSGRDALVRALAGRALDGLADALEEADEQASGEPPVARLAAMGRAYVAWAIAEPELFEVAFGSAREYPGTPVNPRPYDLLKRTVAAADLPNGAESHIWAAVHGLGALASGGPLKGNSVAESCDRAEALVTIVVAGLNSRDK